MNQIEIDISEYLIHHSSNLKPVINSISKLVFSKYSNLIKEEYENYVLETLKDNICLGLNINREDVNCVVNKEFIEKILGKEYLNYEKK